MKFTRKKSTEVAQIYSEVQWILSLNFTDPSTEFHVMLP